MAQNLKRIDAIPWLQRSGAPWRQLDDAAQHALVRLAIASNIPRLQVFGVLESVLLHGNAGGRREAARALAEFHGAEANALALKALDDPDPQVQAHIVAQLRGRGIPGVLPGLVEMVDSPHAVIRKAAQESLAEFSFRRFLGSFDLLDDDVRRSTGLLVKKIDPQTGPLLKEELHSPVRTRRLRALAIARLIDLVERLEEPIRKLLADDDDHMVRMEAAAALGRSDSEASRLALERALGDRSETVRETAARSLQERAAHAAEPRKGMARSPGEMMHALWNHVGKPHTSPKRQRGSATPAALAGASGWRSTAYCSRSEAAWTIWAIRSKAGPAASTRAR